MSFSVYLSYLIRHVSPTLLLPKKSILENTAKSFYRIPAATEELGSKTSILENTAKSFYRIPAATEELGSKTSILENTAKSLPTYFFNAYLTHT